MIGSMKGGTTSLAEYLGAHPDVFMATPKELDFFSNHWDCGSELYEQFFDHAGDAVRPRRAASPRYSRAPKYPNVPKRIASLNPDLRLIYILRQPVERIRSMYAHWFAEGHEDRPFEVAVRDRPEYVDASRYTFRSSSISSISTASSCSSSTPSTSGTIASGRSARGIRFHRCRS